MDVASFTDAIAFADAVQPVIEREPARCNILATVLDQAVAGHPTPDSIWLLIRDGATPVAAGMQTPPFNLFLTPLPDDGRAEAVDRLADALAGARRQVLGVTAEVADARAFADCWHRRTGLSHRLTMAERLYEIDTAPFGPVPEVPGAARPLAEADIPFAAGWIESFNLEVMPERVALPGEQAIRQRLNRGWFLIWEHDGEPVSLAGLNRPAAGVARIGPVYTPGWHRGRGYGSAITAAVTRLGFAQGAVRCALYADLANPTSNAIYRRLGYVPVTDALMIGFH